MTLTGCFAHTATQGPLAERAAGAHGCRAIRAGVLPRRP